MGYQHVHLFAGIGAFALGMRWAGYPSSIRTFTGGFPCQDVSNAGKRAGSEGEHSGLWKEMCRLIQEAMDSGMGPDIIILETVSALIHRGLSTVLGDLAESGWMQDGSVYELKMSERPTSESEYSLWPTPRAEKIGGYSSPDYRPTLAQKVQMWPTPAAQDGKNATCPPSQADRDTLPGSMWRTPQADENGSIKPPEERKGHNLSISNQVQGNLNPEWVEMLQGFPVGYTDISGPQVQGSHSMNGSLQEPLLASNPIGQSD